MPTGPKPPVDPRRWSPPPAMGLDGPFARNDRLADCALWPVPGTGPEDVTVDDDGTVWTGLADGSILALRDGGDRIDRVARTGGRPLGIELLDDGLLVCDADRGLLAVDPTTGAVDELVTRVAGVPLRCTNNAAVAPDGTIWFTDSSRRFSVHHYKGDLIEHSGTGRLLRLDPDGTLTTVLDGLHFANGVALTDDGAAVLVAETGTYRILRHHLTGGRAGQTDTFAEVPGFPDNLSTGPGGTIWCALASPRNPLLDAVLDKPPALRKLIWRLPDAVQPAPARSAIVLGFAPDGTPTHNLQAHDLVRDGIAFHVATGVREHDGRLFVGSLESAAVLVHHLT